MLVEHSGNRQKVKLNFRVKEYNFTGGHRTLAEIQVFTKNGKLVSWLKKHGMGAKMWLAVKKTADRWHCGALLQGKKLVRLELALKYAVARQYRLGTRRSPGRIDVMLIAGKDQTGSDLCTPPVRSPRAKKKC